MATSSATSTSPGPWSGPRIIGAGYGRTGTTSLKRALGILGYGPCYHMDELQQRPDDVGPWIDACLGRPVEWDALLRGFDATLDWPACDFWSVLMEQYPAAKIILTVRDPDTWYQSVMSTGYPILKSMHENAVATGDRIGQLGRLLIMEGRMLDVFPDRERAVAAFEAHNAEVIATAPPQRLLVFDAADGWEPLCGFLDRAVPDQPYPSANSRKAFWRQDAPPSF